MCIRDRFNVKNLNIPFLTSNLTFICRSRSSGHKVIICTLRVAFQIAKPGVDSSSNSRDITIYVLTSLTSVSRSRDKNVKVSVYPVSYTHLRAHETDSYL